MIWPEHKRLQEVLDLRATTPETIWEGTYQGRPTQPGGTVFKRGWWSRERRYDIGDQRLINDVYGRYISWDTANTEEARATSSTATSAYIVADLRPDYRLAIRYARSDYLGFPDLPEAVSEVAGRWNKDGKLKAVLVEDKASGTSAIQTLRAATADPWLAQLLVPFLPTTDKETRAGQAAVWCKNGSVLLPYPDPTLLWLVDLQEQLFDFPRGILKDLVDAFSQLILYLEHILEAGWRARKQENQK